MLWNAHERINHGTRNQNNGNGKDTGWLQPLFQPFNHLFFFACHVSLCLRVAFEEENACLTSSSDKQREILPLQSQWFKWHNMRLLIDWMLM